MRLPLSLVVMNAAVLSCAVVATVAVSSSGSVALRGVPDQPAPAVTAGPSAAPAVTLAPAPAPRATAGVPAPQPAPTPAARRTPQPAPQKRTVVKTGWGPYAQVGPVTLHFPASVVEVVGLHESGHDGAQPQQPVQERVPIGRLDTRARGTNPQGSADVVVDPTREVRSPVTGTVLRAGSYTLYCDHVDDYVVVEPDARPGWEVKMLHFEGLRVARGDRVQAGVTVVGSRARLLPFDSQVDKHTVAPHWPHLHIEVVDPAVPDRPSTGSCD